MFLGCLKERFLKSILKTNNATANRKQRNPLNEKMTIK